MSPLGNRLLPTRNWTDGNEGMGEFNERRGIKDQRELGLLWRGQGAVNLNSRREEIHMCRWQ